MTRADRLVALAVAALTLGLGVQTGYRAGIGRDPGKPTRTDVFAYVAGADALVAGRSPFGVKEEHGYPYVYPPAIALVFTALRPLGRAGVPLAWFAISVATLAVGAASLRRALRPATGPPSPVEDGPPDESLARSLAVRDRLETWLPLALVLLPAASALERGQMGCVLAGLLGLGAAGVAGGRPGRGGLALGAAAALKATPGLAVVVLVLERRPRAVVGAAAALVALLLLGPGLFLGLAGAAAANLDFVRGMGLRYVDDPASAALDPGQPYVVLSNDGNQSLVAILFRALGGGAAFTVSSRAIAVAVVLAAVAPALRARDRDLLGCVAASGLAGAATLLAAPVAWHHHFVVLHPALVAVVADAARRPGSRKTWCGLALFVGLEVLHFAWPAARPLGLLGFGAAIVLAMAARVAWTRSGGLMTQGVRALPVDAPAISP